MILASLFLSGIPTLVFVVLLKVPSLDPFWFYVSNSLIGAINYMSTMFAALSDVVPTQYRAPSYGLMLAGIYGGYSLAPSIPLYLGPFYVATLSFGFNLTALLVAAIFLPETLPEHVRQENLAIQNAIQAPVGALAWTWSAVTRPIREVAILNRDWVIRLVAAGSFFSAMVFASDATLVMYYIEDELNMRANDIATMYVTFGIECQQDYSVYADATWYLTHLIVSSTSCFTQFTGLLAWALPEFCCRAWRCNPCCSVWAKRVC